MTARGRPIPSARHPARFYTALVVSVAAIIAVTLIPTDGGVDVKLTPLADIIAAFSPPIQAFDLLEVVGNVFLFAPLGALLCFRGLRLTRAVLAGVLFSAAIEVTQLLVPGRTTSFDDVLLNALGVVLGHALAVSGFLGRGQTQSVTVERGRRSRRPR